MDMNQMSGLLSMLSGGGMTGGGTPDLSQLLSQMNGGGTDAAGGANPGAALMQLLPQMMMKNGAQTAPKNTPAALPADKDVNFTMSRLYSDKSNG